MMQDWRTTQLLPPRPLDAGPLDVMWCHHCRSSQWHAVPVNGQDQRPADVALFALVPIAECKDRYGERKYGESTYEWRAVNGDRRTGSEARCWTCGTWRWRKMPSTVCALPGGGTILPETEDGS